MTDPQQTHRKQTHFRAKAGRAEVRDAEDGDATRIRMPVSSSAEDRDGDVFSDKGLADLAKQLNGEGERIPMFLNHGRGGESAAMYGVGDMVGHWDGADLEAADDGTQLLYAEGTLYDGHPGAEAARDLLERDAPLGASVGFRPLDSDGDRKGGFEFHETDLLEISLVGIPSNPETVNDAPTASAVAKAVGEASTGFDVETFVDELRDALDTDQGREARDSVTDTDTSGDDAGTTDAKDGLDEAEYRQSMLEMQQRQTETLAALADSLKADDEDDDEDEDEEDDDDEKATEAEEAVEKTVIVDGEEKTVDEVVTELRSALDEARDADGDVEIASPTSKLFDDEPADEHTDDTTKSGDDAGWL